MARDNQNRISDQEWENRVLCSDEACIGTIGQDGRCRECGLAFDGPLPDGTLGTPADDPPDHRFDDDTIIPDDHEIEEDAHSLDEEWEKRTLCRDEACIGTIGPDGKCKECGLPYAESGPDATIDPD